MTLHILQKQIEESVPKLLDIARGLTWNKFSDNCKFIVTEIKNSEKSSHIQRQLRKKENDLKTPAPLQELMPTLQHLYENLFDINLYIYRAEKKLTVIDIRYYSKSSLEPSYKQQVMHEQPMFHCKISMPPWLGNKKDKFDINWEHNEWRIKWKMFWVRIKRLIKYS